MRQALEEATASPGHRRFARSGHQRRLYGFIPCWAREERLRASSPPPWCPASTSSVPAMRLRGWAPPAPSDAAVAPSDGQERWPLDARSRSPRTPGEQHWPLGCLISPNTPRHGPNSVVDQQLPGHGPRAAMKAKTPGKRPAKTPGNARETRKRRALCAGRSENAR